MWSFAAHGGTRRLRVVSGQQQGWGLGSEPCPRRGERWSPQLSRPASPALGAASSLPTAGFSGPSCRQLWRRQLVEGKLALVRGKNRRLCLLLSTLESPQHPRLPPPPREAAGVPGSRPALLCRGSLTAPAPAPAPAPASGVVCGWQCVSRAQGLPECRHSTQRVTLPPCCGQGRRALSTGATACSGPSGRDSSHLGPSCPRLSLRLPTFASAAPALASLKVLSCRQQLCLFLAALLPSLSKSILPRNSQRLAARDPSPGLGAQGAGATAHLVPAGLEQMPAGSGSVTAGPGLCFLKFNFN